MSATLGPPTSTATAGSAFRHGDPDAARLAFGDVRVQWALVGEVRRRGLTGLFGVPGEDQSVLVTLILGGAVVTVLRGLVARPLPRPLAADVAMGGAVVSTAFRAFAGPQSAAIPFAGALIAVAVVSHSVRPTAVACAHQIRRLPREIGTVLGVRHR